ncbi:early nodulin-like protein 2 [Trifolium pratense]|uniref:early nodulin-like protein 2 n=1 Tax=Trifolium pratense TaxID=57577 RepID=UPI001E696C35|nr:early nodulin-like protein 2 [Trifolium pratense]
MDMMRANFVLIMSMIMLSFSLSYGYKFNVGGNDGWAVKPSKWYGQWAENNRFLINDTLYFKYTKGSDSVLVVSKKDYYSCNIGNAIQKLDGGDSTFTFDKSGPFFFISGNVENCKQGEKLIVVVLSPNHRKQGPSSAPSPSWSSPSPASTPVSNAPSPTSRAPTPALTPSLTPKSSAPSPTTKAPSPALTPARTPKSNAPSPTSKAPSPALTPASTPKSNAPSPTSKAPSPTSTPASNAPSPTSKTPSPLYTPPSDVPSPKSPAPSPDHSGSTRFGGFGVGLVVALIIGSFAI